MIKLFSCVLRHHWDIYSLILVNPPDLVKNSQPSKSNISIKLIVPTHLAQILKKQK